MTYVTCQEYRDNIRLLYKEKKYLEGYSLCKEFFYNIKKNRLNWTKNDKYACYGYLSIGSKNLKKYKLSLRYAELSLKYAETYSEIINMKNIIALCYKNLGEIDLAIRIYQVNIKLCDNLLKNLQSNIECLETKDNILESKASLLANIGEITKDERYINDAIYIYKQLNINNNIKQQIIIKKIDSLYENLHEIYLEKNKLLEAQVVINKIKNIDEKQRLLEKIFQFSKVINI